MTMQLDNLINHKEQHPSSDMNGQPKEWEPILMDLRVVVVSHLKHTMATCLFLSAMLPLRDTVGIVQLPFRRPSPLKLIDEFPLVAVKD